eukprot:UN21134
MPIFRYHIASFFPRLSHYAFVELVVENLIAHNFLGKHDCASVQNICALKGFAPWLCFFASSRFFFNFATKKSPTELGSKTMVFPSLKKRWFSQKETSGPVPPILIIFVAPIGIIFLLNLYCRLKFFWRRQLLLGRMIIFVAPIGIIFLLNLYYR